MLGPRLKVRPTRTPPERHPIHVVACDRLDDPARGRGLGAPELAVAPALHAVPGSRGQVHRVEVAPGGHDVTPAVRRTGRSPKAGTLGTRAGRVRTPMRRSMRQSRPTMTRTRSSRP
jgi:hypothetical protein